MVSTDVWFCPNDWRSLLFRLGLALLAGGIIGWNRELKRKPAGLRTHILVTVGSALFVMVPLQAGCLTQEPDALSRTIQGVATGIGFLGAGEILEQSRQDSARIEIKGLTSASALWVSAGLGVAAGCGLWLLTVIGSGLTLLVLTVFKRLEQQAMRSSSRSD
jgi:putative Mg2+ transporter-C (MgtC) family protein